MMTGKKKVTDVTPLAFFCLALAVMAALPGAPGAPGALGAAEVERTLAIVNDEQILTSDFGRISLPLIEEFNKKNPKATDDELAEFKKTILEEMVNNKLIVQQAKKQKIAVSQRNLDEQINKIKGSFDTDKEFREELKKEKMSYDQFVGRIKDQLMAEELTYREVTSKIPKTFTEKEIDEILAQVKNKLLGRELDGGLSDQQKQGIETVSEVFNRYVQNLKAQEKYSEWVKKLRAQGKVKINSLD